MSEPLLVGVDGGGTKCRVRIRDLAGSMIGEAEGGLDLARSIRLARRADG